MGGAARPALLTRKRSRKSLRAINGTSDRRDCLGELPQVQRADYGDRRGVISTASGLVFFGENSGAFMASLSASDGKRRSGRFQTNHVYGKSSPMTYMFDNKQRYVAVAAGQDIVAVRPARLIWRSGAGCRPAADCQIGLPKAFDSEEMNAAIPEPADRQARRFRFIQRMLRSLKRSRKAIHDTGQHDPPQHRTAKRCRTYQNRAVNHHCTCNFAHSNQLWLGPPSQN